MLRLEPGLEWSDFDMRMDDVGMRAKRTDRNFIGSVQDESRRNRRKFSILSWGISHFDHMPAMNRAVLAKLSQSQIETGTTRGTTPGLINPCLPDSSINRIPVPGPRNGSRDLLAPGNNLPLTHYSHRAPRPDPLPPGYNLTFINYSCEAPRPRPEREIETSDLDADGWTDYEYEPEPLQNTKRIIETLDLDADGRTDDEYDPEPLQDTMRDIETSDLDADGWTDYEYEPEPLQDIKRIIETSDLDADGWTDYEYEPEALQ